LKSSAKKSTAEPEVSRTQHALFRILKEGALIGWLLVCIYLLLALFSYSPSDPDGWSTTGTLGQPVLGFLVDSFLFLGISRIYFP